MAAAASGADGWVTSGVGAIAAAAAAEVLPASWEGDGESLEAFVSNQASEPGDMMLEPASVRSVFCGASAKLPSQRASSPSAAEGVGVDIGGYG